MVFGHEQLHVYRLAIDYVAWAYLLAKELSGVDRHARDQLLPAAQSIPLNIAEGNGKGTNADRRRFFEIARGSALELCRDPGLSRSLPSAQSRAEPPGQDDALAHCVDVDEARTTGP